MRRPLGAAVCLMTLGAASPCMSAQSLTANVTSTTPAAYVYVATTPANSSTNEIVAYRVAADGSLTEVSGSPFREDVTQMVVNGRYLMAINRTTSDVDVYRMGTDGGLAWTEATNYAPFNGGNDCGEANQLFFDHTGSTLYVQEFNGTSACANSVYAAFNVGKTSGKLSYLNTVDEGAFPGVYAAAFFTGDNKYAYTASNELCMYYQVYGLTRAANGSVTGFTPNVNLPAPPAGASTYLLNGAAADPTNHVAFWLQPANPPGCANLPVRLASYTVDAAGNLSTTNTLSNMPQPLVQTINDLKMSPSGKLIAVGGQEGLQVYHFNGGKPMTHDTGLLGVSPVQQMFWDNSDHLYAISPAANKLYVFTVTPTGYRQAPGSPHILTSKPVSLIVQPTGGK